MAAYRHLVRQFDACIYIGREHAWRAYVYTPALMTMIRQHALFALVDQGK
jgi:hypothetical protein